MSSSTHPPQQSTQDIIRYLLVSGIDKLNHGEGLVALVHALRLSCALRAEAASDPVQQQPLQALQQESSKLMPVPHDLAALRDAGCRAKQLLSQDSSLAGGRIAAATAPSKKREIIVPVQDRKRDADGTLKQRGGFKSAKQQYAVDLCKKGQHQQAAAMFNNQGAPRAGLSRRGRGGGPSAAAGRAGFVPPFVGKAIAHHTGKSSFAVVVFTAALAFTLFSCAGTDKAGAGSAGGGGEEGEGVLSAHTLEMLGVSCDGDLPPELAKHDLRLIEQVCKDVIDASGGVSWDDIAGKVLQKTTSPRLETAKHLIKEIVVWPMLNPKIFTGPRAPPKGILLFGPPGTGKTLIGKAVASNIKAAFFSISASSLTSKWIGEGEKMVKTLFAVAAHLQPSVIFIDEIDSILSARKSEGEHEASRRLKTEMLVQMEGCDPGSASRRVLLVGATNRPEELDEAARRRMPKQLYIPLPCAEARRNMLLRQLGPGGKVSSDLSPADLDKVVAKTEGYSGSDMRNLIQEACQGPVRAAVARVGEQVAALSDADLRPVRLKDFQHAAKAQRASVTPAEILRYEEYNERHGAKYVLQQQEGQEEADSEGDDDWMTILNHIRAIEKEATFCTDVLQGIVQQPSPESWSAAKQRCQELQKQWNCQAIPAAAQLSDMLASSLQICQVADEQTVDQKPGVHAEHAMKPPSPPQHQQHGIAAEISSLRLLAEQLALLATAPHQGQQQQQQQPHPAALPNSCMSAQNDNTSAHDDGHLSNIAANGPLQTRSPEAALSADGASGNTFNFLRQCQCIRNALQQLYDVAVDKTIVQTSSSSSDDTTIMQPPQHECRQQLGQHHPEDKQHHHQQKLVIGHDVGDVPQHDLASDAANTSLRELRCAALQAQANCHSEALTRLSQQHSETCARLAEAVALQNELRQQLAQVQQENKQLQQQLSKVSALPTPDAVASLVKQTAAAQLASQQQQYQAALQHREQQHVNLLQDLTALRDLQAELSTVSEEGPPSAPVAEGSACQEASSTPSLAQAQLVNGRY
eukprot:gene5200-5438_t